MDRMEYLKEQATKAERLARGVVDSVTVERLMAFAAACRAEVNAQTDQDQARLIDHFESRDRH